MNKVNLTIESCYDCPHSKMMHAPLYSFMFDGFTCYCTKTGRKIWQDKLDKCSQAQKIGSRISIPDWCPMIKENTDVKKKTKHIINPILHTVYLHDLAPGDCFYFGGNEFILLEKYKSACRAIRKKSWKTCIFDNNNHNNLRISSILHELEQYVKYLDNNSSGITSRMMPQQIILKATDGSDDYGQVSPIAGLLTLEQYGRYKEYLHQDDTAFWLASPHEPYSSSIGEKCVWVANNGIINPAPVSVIAGVRPVIMLIASTKVDTRIKEDSENETNTVE